MKILACARRFIDGATESRTHPNTVRLFRRVIYCWYFLSAVLLLPAAGELWGPQSLIPRNPWPEISVLNLLDLPAVRPYYAFFIGAHLALLVLGMTCLWPRTIALLIYVTAMNLNNRAWVTLDGGDNLMQLMLIYLIVMDPSPSGHVRRPGMLTYANNALTNAAFLIARLQVVAVYLVAGLGKVDGELWQNGTALYYTLSVDDFTLPVVQMMVAQFPILSVAGTYATLAYQVSFPWLIWNRRVRPYLMAFGTFLHLQIALVMGLFSFGLAVMASYAIFFTDARSEKVFERCAAWGRALSVRIPPAAQPAPATGDGLTHVSLR